MHGQVYSIFGSSVKCIDACRVKRIALTKLSTGKSIGEHLDAAIEKRYDMQCPNRSATIFVVKQ